VSQEKDPKAEPRQGKDAAGTQRSAGAQVPPATASPQSTMRGPNGIGAARPPSSTTLRPDPATRPGVPPQSATSIKGRATLAFDGGIPPTELPRSEGDVDRPPIVVPSTTATTPKAITQPPPWTEGAAKLGPRNVPRNPAPRGKFASSEEISASMFLPEDAARAGGDADAEELSGSLLVEEATANAPLRVTRNAGAASRPPVPAPSHKPANPAATTVGASRPPPLTRSPDARSAVPPPPRSTVPAPPPTMTERPPPAPAAGDEIDRKTKPHLSPSAADAAARDSAGERPIAATAKPVVDDLPTSPAAVDAGPPTEDSLPRGVETPPPMPALKPVSPLARVQRGWVRVVEAAREAGRRARGAGQRARGAGQRAREAGRHAREAGQRGVAWLREKRPAIEAALEARSRWVLPVVAVLGLVLGVSIMVWFFSAARRGADAEAAAKAPPNATAAAPSSAASPEGTPQSAGSQAPAPKAPPAACTVAGERRTLAPKALVPAGVEARPLGDALGIGFASSDRQAIAMRLDATTLATMTTTTSRSKTTVRRVTPATSGSAIAALVDADRKGDALAGRRGLAGDSALQIGVADGALQWAKQNGSPAGKLWDLEGDGEVDAIRTAESDAPSGHTTAVVFRRAGAVYVGLASGDGALTPQGPLMHFVGSGPAIGSPAIALQDGVVFVAWADRASPDDRWRVRWVRFKAGETPGEPTVLVAPGAPADEQTMSPAVVAVPDRRFLLVWTEGPQSRHAVRALTFGEDGAPIGGPLAVSAEGSNAGQGQAAVTPSGRGLIAYLESTDDGFAVAAAPVSCAP
jgi:hypothetical protein